MLQTHAQKLEFVGVDVDVGGVLVVELVVELELIVEELVELELDCERRGTENK